MIYVGLFDRINTRKGPENRINSKIKSSILLFTAPNTPPIAADKVKAYLNIIDMNKVGIPRTKNAFIKKFADKVKKQKKNTKGITTSF